MRLANALATTPDALLGCGAEPVREAGAVAAGRPNQPVALAWPIRSTPTTQPKPPARPAATPACASS